MPKTIIKKKALEILRERYLSKDKPKIISLHIELTFLRKSVLKSITDNAIKAENATSL